MTGTGETLQGEAGQPLSSARPRPASSGQSGNRKVSKPEPMVWGFELGCMEVTGLGVKRSFPTGSAHQGAAPSCLLASPAAKWPTSSGHSGRSGSEGLK